MEYLSSLDLFLYMVLISIWMDSVREAYFEHGKLKCFYFQ